MKKIYLCMCMFIVVFFGGIVANAEEHNFQEIQAESVSVDDGKLTVFSDSYFEFFIK